MSSTPPIEATAPPVMPSSAAPSPPKAAQGMTEGQKKALLVALGVAAVALLAVAVWAAILLVNNPAQASSVRDVFIIFMALEFMVIGAALVVLVFQLAVLTNMLRHEIKPILESTNETVNTVRGTTLFVSENLVEPIMKLNGYVAALSRVVEAMGALTGLAGLGRKR